jgi:hypothetical protein
VWTAFVATEFDRVARLVKEWQAQPGTGHVRVVQADADGVETLLCDWTAEVAR